MKVTQSLNMDFYKISFLHFIQNKNFKLFMCLAKRVKYFHPLSHLVESRNVSAFCRENCASCVVWAHLELALHLGAGGEAKVVKATIRIGSNDEGEDDEASEADSNVHTFASL